MEMDEVTGEVVSYKFRRSEQIDALFDALAKAQLKFEPVKKSGKNPHFGNRYPTLEDVIDATRKALSENGLAITQMPVNHLNAIGVCTLLVHRSGQWIESMLAIAPFKMDAQAIGSVISYIRRYTRMAVLDIAPEDDDAEAATDHQAQRDGARQQPNRRFDHVQSRVSNDPASLNRAPQPQQPQPPTQPAPALATKQQQQSLWAAVLTAFPADEKGAGRWLGDRFKFYGFKKWDELTQTGWTSITNDLAEFTKPENVNQEPTDIFAEDAQPNGEATEVQPDQQTRRGRKGKDNATA